MQAIVDTLIYAANPVFFPGPQLLWDWKKSISEKARTIKEFAETAGAQIIPMPDCRPKYPMINLDAKYTLIILIRKSCTTKSMCVFVGVHCHDVNIALKIIRGGTQCCTTSLCAWMGHEDAIISLRDIRQEKIKMLKEMALSKNGGSMHDLKHFSQ